jgi:hypothetical protein
MSGRGMARRRPAQVRRSLRRRSSVPLAGIPMTTSHALDRLDVDRLSSGNVGVELGTWLKVSALSTSQLDGPYNDWSTFIGPGAREILNEAMNALDRRHAAPLRAVVYRADEQFLAKTLHNPDDAPGGGWWWERRPM